jgi:hypothetical protein
VQFDQRLICIELFFCNIAFIHSSPELQSRRSESKRKQGGSCHTELVLGEITCLAHRWDTSFALRLICMHSKEIIIDANSSIAFRMTAISDRCPLRFFQKLTNYRESDSIISLLNPISAASLQSCRQASASAIGEPLNRLVVRGGLKTNPARAHALT